MARVHLLFRSELDALRAARERLEGVLRDLVGRVCTGYSGFRHIQASNYRKRLSAAVFDAQSKAANVSEYFIRVDKDGYLLSIDKSIKDEERVDHPSTPRSDVDDLSEVIVALLNPPPSVSQDSPGFSS